MEKEKFIETISENQNLIYKICNSYCSNHIDRKDLEQEIILQLWKSMSKFDGRVKITTWMYKIALNTAISYYRKDRKRIDKPTDFDKQVFYLSDIEYDPQIDKKIEIIYQLIGQLSSLDKALILLYLDNYNQKTIAEIIGISETNVATKIYRIKKGLQEKVSNI